MIIWAWNIISSNLQSSVKQLRFEAGKCMRQLEMCDSILSTFSSLGKPLFGKRIMRPRFRIAAIRYVKDENSLSSPLKIWSSKSSMYIGWGIF